MALVCKKQDQCMGSISFHFQESGTPRSNRSVDSGLPQDDLTPRSDSFSTGSSSVSPPESHQNQSSLQQHPGLTRAREHRKSTSLDDINLEEPASGYCQDVGNARWKSSSLQRGLQPANNSPDTSSTSAATPGTLIIRRNRPFITHSVAGDDEDIYGRNLNMKTLSSFAEEEHPPIPIGLPTDTTAAVTPGIPAAHQQACHRDPRVIDLSTQSVHSTVSSVTPTPSSMASTPRQGSPVAQIHCQSQFNTLPGKACPAQLLETGLPTARLPQAGTTPLNHYTLPARMADHQSGFTGVPNRSQSPSVRHFKPFDHRRLNPMTEIQESPADEPADPHHRHSVVSSGNAGSSIASKSPQLPHLPSKLLHTNYSSNS